MTDDQTRRPQTTVREQAIRECIAATCDQCARGVELDKDGPTWLHWEDKGSLACFAQHLYALLDAREAQPPTGWQPIATAPEATTVFVWLPNYGAFPAHMTRDANGNPDWWNRGDNEPCYPTHWRPMFEKPGESPAQPPTGTPAEPKTCATCRYLIVHGVSCQVMQQMRGLDYEKARLSNIDLLNEWKPLRLDQIGCTLHEPPADEPQ